MRLRVIQVADFRRSEKTNFDRFWRKRRRLNVLSLGPDDVVCFISQSHDQVVFVWKPAPVDLGKHRGKAREGLVVRSQRLRLTPYVWEPLMLQNYANKMGIKLDGIKRFEEIMKKVRVPV